MNRRLVSHLVVGGVATLAVVGLVAFLAGVASPSKRSTTITGCRGSAALDLDCFVDRYNAMFSVRGIDAALADLKRERSGNGLVKVACHQLTHVIGRAAGRKYGALAFGKGNSLCSSGYYHGVAESVMARMGAATIVAQADEVCADQRRRERYSYHHYNCVHGMGHGFMGLYGSDVFKSLRGCDVLVDRWEQDRCSGGVFMENLTAIDNPTRPSRYLKPDHPLYPCTAVAAQYKGRCYEQQTSYGLYVLNEDFAQVFALCATTPDRAFRGKCYEGLGGDAAARANKTIVGTAAIMETTRRLCLLGRTDAARQHCVIGAVTTIIRDREAGVARARHLCKTFTAGEAGLRIACHRGIAAADLEFAPPRAVAQSACSGASAIDFDCWVQHYHGVLHRRGIAAALRELEVAYEAGGYVRSVCHELAHELGHMAGAHHVRDLRRAYDQGNAVCSGGYYHGATEAVMVALGTRRLLDATTVCTWLRSAEPHSRRHFSCVHGMGHGFMALFRNDVSQSLHACDGLDPWEREHCYGGVFMENLTAMGDPRHPVTDLRPDQPLYPCTAVARRYKSKCYEKQTAYPLFLHDGDFAATFALCARTPDRDFRPACYRGLGDRAVVRSTKLVMGAAATARTIVGLCMLGAADDARSSCTAGAVQTIVRQGQSVALAEAFCASVPKRLRATCSAARGATVRQFSDSAQVKA